MGTHSPKARGRLTRRTKVLLTLLIFCTWVGTAGIVVGAILLQGAESRGHLLTAVGLLAYTAAGAAASLIPDNSGNGGATLAGPSWIRASRLTWIVLGAGVFLALIEVVFWLAPSLSAT